MRHALLLPVLGLALWAHGQQHHYFAVDGPLDRDALKPAIQAVIDVDPTAEVFSDGANGLLHVRTMAGTSESTLREALTTGGLTLLPGTPDMAAGPARTTAEDGKPLYILTGDETGDRQRYEEAVRLWNLAHPEDPITLPNH